MPQAVLYVLSVQCAHYEQEQACVMEEKVPSCTGVVLAQEDTIQPTLQNLKALAHDTLSLLGSGMNDDPMEVLLDEEGLVTLFLPTVAPLKDF